MSGYPPPVGFNLNNPSGYPPQGPGGYPPQGGYPPAHGGYPPPGGAAGYPPPAGGGYAPPACSPAGYPPPGAGAPGGWPPPQGAYPPAGGYPPQGPAGYPAPGGQCGYPGQGGYPPQQGPSGSYGGSIGYQQGGQGLETPGGMMPSSFYYTGRPTVIPAAPFDPGEDAEQLRKAMRGMGTDEAKIIRILSKRTSYQRLEIAKKYKASFGKDLDKHLKSELSGKFEDLVLLSIDSLPGMLASAMFLAMKGAGTDEKLLMQCIIPYPNAVIHEMCNIYNQRYGSDIVKDVRRDTSGDFEKILVSMLQGQRDENAPVDLAKAAADAEALYKAGENRLGTEEAVFTRILSQRSFPQIKAIAAAYLQKYGRTLEKAIDKETSGDYKDVMIYIVRYAEDKNTLLASWFYESMVGMGTRDKALMQLVLSRSEIDLEDVKLAYQTKYGKSLARAIEGDTSGDYKRMLLAMVGN